MTVSPLKFVHASDFHLDRPISGLEAIPAHLKSTLANAPYAAAENVFGLAISEQVDFILLSGDVVDLDLGGPRAAAFLLGQFERAADKNIEVYWCSGSVDQPDRWPSGIELPDNVVIFPSSIVEHCIHLRDNRAIATICGSGIENKRRNPSDFRCDEASPFPIALAHGKFDTSSIASQNIRYWALGGKHKRTMIEKTGTVAVYAGTTQGRSPNEPGPHGCTLVRVDSQGKIKAQAYDIDSVRWSLQTINVAESTNLQQLKDVLGERCLKIRNEAPEQTLLIEWKIETTGDFRPQLRSGDWNSELVHWLRTEFGQATGSLWTTRLNIDPPKSLPAEWYEEETILGDYLRAIGRFQGDSTMAFALHDYVGEENQHEPLADLGRVSAESRELTLRQAALVGVEYLARHDQETPGQTYH